MAAPPRMIAATEAPPAPAAGRTASASVSPAQAEAMLTGSQSMAKPSARSGVRRAALDHRGAAEQLGERAAVVGVEAQHLAARVGVVAVVDEQLAPPVR
jgi:hypothetical protein